MTTMKVLVFSDIHLDHKDPKWMSNMRSTFAFLRDTIRKEGVSHVFCLGDLIDTPYHVKTPALDLLSDGVKMITDALPTMGSLIIIQGNHDLFLQKDKSISNIRWLNGYAQVDVVTDGFLSFPPFLFVPYHRDNDEWLDTVKQAKATQKGIKYLMCHQPINGLVFTDSSQEAEGVSLSSIPFTKIYNGHYHGPQKISKGKKTVEVIGAPTGFNFSDESNGKPPRGFLLLTLEPTNRSGMKVTEERRITNPCATFFHTCNFEDLIPDYLPELLSCQGSPHLVVEEDTHIRVRVPAHKTKELAEYMKGRKFSSWKAVIQQATQPIRREVGINQTDTQDAVSIVSEYVTKFFEGEDTDRQVLIDMGLALLKG